MTTTELITPSLAAEYLKTSKGNRPISKPSVTSYAKLMVDGKWMLNGVPIIFDNCGCLIDGHHRLYAVISANVPVQMDVKRGVSPEAFKTYDCGHHRTLGQLLAINRTKHYNAAASIVVASERLGVSGRFYGSNTAVGNGRLMNFDTYDIYSRDAELYNEAAEKACDWYGELSILSISWAGAFYHHLVRRCGYERDFAAKFFDDLFSLKESKCNAINILRARLVKAKMDKILPRRELLCAILIKTWNAYALNKDMKKVGWDDEREEYPIIIKKQQIL